MPTLPRLLLASPAAVLIAAAPANAADGPIDAFEQDQQAAWNAHDAAAYAAAFAADANVISMQGWHWAGRADAARNLADGFRFVYAHARLDLAEVHARSLAPDLAVVTLRWSIAGARALDSGQPTGVQQGYETQLLQRQGDHWAILSQQDTMAGSPPAASPSTAAAAPSPAAPATSYPTTPPPVRRCLLARGNGDCIIYAKPRPAS